MFIYLMAQIFEIVNLANELLPPLPDGTISLPASCNIFEKGSHLKKPPASSSEIQIDSTKNSYDISTREKLLNEQPELLHQFGTDLLPVLIQVIFQPVKSDQFFVIGCINYFHSFFFFADLWIECEWFCSAQVPFCYWKTDVL